MEGLKTTTVGPLLSDLKPHIGARYSDTPKVKEKLSTLDDDCRIKVYGEYSFRLADDEPSYFIDQILICK